ncbi:MAG TPA: HlyD family secretion protein [Xanthobacteraceae bacterium]|jgi:membrane fusion protein, multidrug efflux system|nr:HlyD family secretion protein [Xanthobacteraceae bacterium]
MDAKTRERADTSLRAERGDPQDRRDQVRAEKPADQPRALLRDNLRRHPYAAAGAGIAVLLVLAAVVAWWLHARNYESTDDAFIDARTVTVASQLTGTIVAVPVNDNQEVPAGATLVEIDPRDYANALAEANAQVEQAAASITNLDAQIEAQNARIDAAKKQVEQAQAALTFSRQEAARAQDLLSHGAGTQQQAQQTASDLRQKEAALLTAQANETAAEKQIAILQAQKQSAQAQLEQANASRDQAQTNLSRTQIKASESGRVTKLSAAVGGLAQPGQALMVFVPTRVWVTANFKETQLDRMRPGQPVDITVDAYPGRVLHGHVDSIQAGSGAAFSLLPPENATGNFVKVVQRVPVKIVFDGDPGVYVGPGMSVVPTVKVR